MNEDYEKAKKRGERAYRRAVLTGRYPYLPALDDFLKQEGPVSEESVGLIEIPLSMVVGTRTRGRQSAFAWNFMPLLPEKSEFGAKWIALNEAQVEEGIRDPIKVYEYMQRFYVEEGNKRVSVLRFVGAGEVLANVIRLRPARTEAKERVVYYEFLEFYRVCPVYGITMSEPGSYQKLAEAVGEDLTEYWPEEKVKSLRSAYGYFAEAYEPYGRDLTITCGDAFLLYLQIYPLESLTEATGTEIRKNLERIQNELRTRTNADRLALVETPEQVEKTGGSLAGNLTGKLLHRGPAYTKEHPLRAAFLYDKTPEASAWIYGHELGRNELAARFPEVETSAFTGCTTDEKIREAVETAAAEGHSAVFTVSPTMMPEILRCAIRHPDMKFLNCSVNLQHNAVRTYYARMHEAKFLMGALAASLAENHLIGYRADYPIYGAMANINAFAIGAAMVDPEAKILLRWATEKDTDWRKEMEESGVTVFSGPDLIKPEEASRFYGLYRKGGDGSVENLAIPVVNWGKYYEFIVGSILDGSFGQNPLARSDQAMNYWLGMSAGIVEVIFSEKLSYYSKKMIRLFRQAVTAGSLHPFDGELRSQEGVIKGADDPRLTAEQMITMDWLNDNVIGSVPKYERLNDEAREAVSVSGVLRETPSGVRG